jgi:hypothetical protein
MGGDGGFGPPPPPPDPGYGEHKDPQRGRAGSGVSTSLPGNPPAAAGRSAGGVPAQEGRRALAGFLVSYQDDPLGKFWPLWQGRNGIGRADTGQKLDIEIAHGTTSTHHAAIDCEGGRFVLHDLGSTNGTFHNEDAIGFKGRRELRDGDKIRFGGFSVITIIITARTT